MSGVGWALLAGASFGVFQSVNAAAVRQLGSVYFSTFLQLFAAAVTLLLVLLVSGRAGRLFDVSLAAAAYFAAAGLLHFFAAWTLMNRSQTAIGAARTAPLLATVPVWAIGVTAVTLGETPTAIQVVGILVMTCGAAALSSPRALGGMRWIDGRFAIGTAMLWAISPIFTVRGLDYIDDPLVGVTVGVVAATAAYAVLIAASAVPRERLRSLPRGPLAVKLLCGALVAFATWSRWTALGVAAPAVVLALNLVSIPIVFTLAPLFGRGTEQLDRGAWLGAGLIVTGTIVLAAAA